MGIRYCASEIPKPMVMKFYIGARQIVVLIKACFICYTSRHIGSNARLRERLTARLKRLDYFNDSVTTGLKLVQKILSSQNLVTFCDLVNNADLADVILQSIYDTPQSCLSRAWYAFDINRPVLLKKAFEEDPNVLSRGRLVIPMHLKAISLSILIRHVHFLRLKSVNATSCLFCTHCLPFVSLSCAPVNTWDKASAFFTRASLTIAVTARICNV